MLQGPPATRAKARILRRTMSLPEVLLWRELRKRPEGLKFRRQHPAGDFVLDFYCHEARLVVEVDGSGHDNARRAERDSRRDRQFELLGMRVIRIPAADVLRDPCDAASAIAALAQSELRRGEVH